MKEDEGRTLWLDTQSHASSSASSADDDYTWQWPTSFWSQFKVSIPNKEIRLINPLEQEIRKLIIIHSFGKKNSIESNISVQNIILPEWTNSKEIREDRMRITQKKKRIYR